MWEGYLPLHYGSNSSHFFRLFLTTVAGSIEIRSVLHKVHALCFDFGVDKEPTKYTIRSLEPDQFTIYDSVTETFIHP